MCSITHESNELFTATPLQCDKRCVCNDTRVWTVNLKAWFRDERWHATWDNTDEWDDGGNVAMS